MPELYLCVTFFPRRVGFVYMCSVSCIRQCSSRFMMIRTKSGLPFLPFSIYMADLQGLRHKMIGRYILVEGYALGCKLSYTLPFLLWYSLSVQSLLLSSSSFFHHRCDAIQCDAMVILTFINCKRFVMRLILAFGSWQYRY